MRCGGKQVVRCAHGSPVAEARRPMTRAVPRQDSSARPREWSRESQSERLCERATCECLPRYRHQVLRPYSTRTPHKACGRLPRGRANCVDESWRMASLIARTPRARRAYMPCALWYMRIDLFVVSENQCEQQPTPRALLLDITTYNVHRGHSRHCTR